MRLPSPYVTETTCQTSHLHVAKSKWTVLYPHCLTFQQHLAEGTSPSLKRIIHASILIAEPCPSPWVTASVLGLDLQASMTTNHPNQPHGHTICRLVTPQIHIHSSLLNLNIYMPICLSTWMSRKYFENITGSIQNSLPALPHLFLPVFSNQQRAPSAIKA